MTIKSPHYEPDPNVTWIKDEEKGRFILKPRGLSITWGNESRYWRIPQPNEDGPAQLKNVCTLELGASKEIDPKKSYEIGFKVTLTRKWLRGVPIFIMVKRGDRGNYIARKVMFDGCNLNEEFDIPGNFEIKFLPGHKSEPKIHIGLFDHWNNNWKSGLLVHHAFVREVNDHKRK